MKKKPYYLKYYKEWMGSGRITEAPSARLIGGLCGSPIRLRKDFSLMTPAADDRDVANCGYWAYDGTDGTGVKQVDLVYQFTPLRQTIVLFLAAMNGELTKENLKRLGL